MYLRDVVESQNEARATGPVPRAEEADDGTTLVRFPRATCADHSRRATAAAATSANSNARDTCMAAQ